MKAVDTNVLLRFFVEDENLQQSMLARKLMQAASPSDPVFVPGVVTAETVWVLRRRLRYPQKVVCALLRTVLSSAGILFEHGDELFRLLTANPDSSGDIADNLVVLSAKAAGCSSIYTFDKRAARSVPGMELLE